MTDNERKILQDINDRINFILHGDFSVKTRDHVSDPEFEKIYMSVANIAMLLDEAQEFITALSNGDLDIYPPPRNILIGAFKQLHSNLRHLSWQTKQISQGDLNQRVDFLGEFSVSFNLLIKSLREKKVIEENIMYISIHDPLTELYNRRYFEEELARASHSRDFPISIIIADLDDLKKTNDTMGHSVGDTMIKNAAKLLKKATRSGDVLARIGGDEFSIILYKTDTDMAFKIAERIETSESEFNSTSRQYSLGISLGVATADERGQLNSALRQADKKMYEKKFLRKKNQP